MDPKWFYQHQFCDFDFVWNYQTCHKHVENLYQMKSFHAVNRNTTTTSWHNGYFFIGQILQMYSIYFVFDLDYDG